MARLSNFLRAGDGEASDAPIACRPARRDEIEHGLRLILADASGLAGDDAVLDFVSFAAQRKIDTSAMWVAELGGRIVWALLPIVSPGRTMLLFTPGRLVRQTPPRAVRLLSDAVCAHFASQNVTLAQLLLDPADRTTRELYRTCGFEDLAELLYLQKRVAPSAASIDTTPPAAPDGWALVQYSDAAHALFADAIVRSYEGSLDCPALNGRREIDDVIAGHRGTGVFDPTMWLVLLARGRERATSREPRGVLLLNPTLAGDAVELVYLGLTPTARGKGAGDLLMRVAVDTTARRGFPDLTCAVDARNAPAIKLYHRHGMRNVGSRIALVRELV